MSDLITLETTTRLLILAKADFGGNASTTIPYNFLLCICSTPYIINNSLRRSLPERIHGKVQSPVKSETALTAPPPRTHPGQSKVIVSLFRSKRKQRKNQPKLLLE